MKYRILNKNNSKTQNTSGCFADEGNKIPNSKFHIPHSTRRAFTPTPTLAPFRFLKIISSGVIGVVQEFLSVKNRSGIEKQRQSWYRGFTLVEMIIYVAIFSFLSIVAVSGIIVTMKSFYAIRLAQNINQSATAAMERMAYETRNAYDIDTANSDFNSTPGRLTLMTKDSVGNNTTVEFYSTSTANVNATWLPTGSTSGYRGVAVSSDGTYQTAVGPGDYIYVSSDRGITWTQKGTSQWYYGIDMSSDGMYQTAVSAGYIYTSSNYGATWTQRSTYHNHYGVAISSSGQYQTAVSDTYIYTSSNYGVSWTQRGLSRDYADVDMSDDGVYQTAVTINGYIYRSVNSGVNWDQVGTSNDRRAIAMSSSGQYQTTGGSSGNIEISSNYGANWTTKTPVNDYWGATMSSDGMYQALAALSGYVYLSSDYGESWTQTGTSQNYTSIAMTSDGGLLASTSDTIYEYITKLYQLRMKVGGVEQGSLMVNTSTLNNFIFRPITTPNSKAVKIEMTVRDARQEFTSIAKFYDTIILRGSLH